MDYELSFQRLASMSNELFARAEKIVFKNVSQLSIWNQEEIVIAIKEAVLIVLKSLMKLSPEKVFYFVSDAMFAPNVVVRQVVLILTLRFGIIGFLQLYQLSENISLKFTAKGRKKEKLTQALEDSQTYDEWLKVSNELDRMNGFDIWRKEKSCPFLDYKSIIKRTIATRDMMKRGDVFNLMFRLRGGLSRTQFGLQHEGLYSRALAGTKHVVEDYNETISAALNMIADTPRNVDNIPTDAKLAFFNETRHAYGRTALMLSGGAYMGFYHHGVCITLYRMNLLPRVISGASAGSIAASKLGTSTDEELEEVGEANGYAARHCCHFFRFHDQIKSEAGQWFQYFTPTFLRPLITPLLVFIFDGKFVQLDSEYFRQEIIKYIGPWTFQEAFDRTGRIINITVAPPNPYDPPRLLNYLTAPHITVWSAVCASCAVPGAFDSCQLYVKEPDGRISLENLWTRQDRGNVSEEEITKGQGYTDGSLDCDLPMKQLSELFNVSHFIISQTNPHAAFLSSLNFPTTVWSNPFYGGVVSYFQFLLNEVKDFTKNFLNLLISRSLAPTWSKKRGIFNVLSQDYEGSSEDIMIFPWRSHATTVESIVSIFNNPSISTFLGILKAGERETWRVLPRIQANSLIELTLDRCVQKLRRRVTEENEVDSVPEINNEPLRDLQDRTAFYTLRSLVKLSGLSVSDPIPKNYYQDTLNLTVAGEDVPLTDATDSPTNLSSTNNYSNLNELEPAIPSFVPRSRNSSIASFGGTEDQLNHSNQREKSELHSTGIKKTTSMAKFYYRDSSNASSNDSLSMTK